MHLASQVARATSPFLAGRVGHAPMSGDKWHLAVMDCRASLAMTAWRGANVRKLLPDRLAHHLGQGLPLCKLTQGFIYQGLVVATGHFSFGFENCQRCREASAILLIVVYAYFMWATGVFCSAG